MRPSKSRLVRGSKLSLQAILLLAAAIVLSACGDPGATSAPGEAPHPPTEIAGAGDWPVVIWERSGGMTGICQTLTIDHSGDYALQTCGDEASPQTGELSADYLLELQRLESRYASFHWQADPGDGFADRYTWYGKGEAAPGAQEQAELNEFLAGLAFELNAPTVAATLPAGAEQSGIEGQALVGPACPGPIQPGGCPDQPYQATLTVLNEAGEVVTQVVTDAEGRFRVSLPPGNYVLRPESPGRYPTASEIEFSVSQGRFTQLQVNYDSGMR